METFGLSQTAADEVNVPLGHGDTPLRFLLEGVQDVDRLPEADRVDGAPRVAIMVRDNFNHRAPAKTFQRLCRRVDFSLLSGIEGVADIAPDLAREAAQVSPA